MSTEETSLNQEPVQMELSVNSEAKQTRTIRRGRPRKKVEAEAVASEPAPEAPVTEAQKPTPAVIEAAPTPKATARPRLDAEIIYTTPKTEEEYRPGDPRPEPRREETEKQEVRESRENRENRDNRETREGRDNREGREDRHRHQHQHRRDQRQDFRNRNRPQQQQQQQQRSQHHQQASSNRQQDNRQQGQKDRSQKSKASIEVSSGIILNDLPNWELLKDLTALENLRSEISSDQTPLIFDELKDMHIQQLAEFAVNQGITFQGAPSRKYLIRQLLTKAVAEKRPIIARGVLEKLSKGAVLVSGIDNYTVKPMSVFISEAFMKEYGLTRGHMIEAQIHPPREGNSCPFALKINSVMGMDPKQITHITPFEELTPYYPTRRLLLETNANAQWDNLSMRIVDILTPIGLGQRGLIVAPPRTGKTVLLQCIAHAIAKNNPDAHLIILLIDERPEEVTDFKRQVTTGEVISSTFDESADSHVHAAEMVIEKARRMVEVGKDVVILLDSITRLARAYNAMMPSSGKILSGGVEANALQKPKRFFGSARNIEGAGSLTILGTALIETGSRMDEVIFEEFKGTGNMELHLDRSLVEKRLFPAISMDRSGTRKEELLYHPDEIDRIYALRRAMSGIPPLEAMEMLIQRVRKTKSNVEFLMGLNR